MLRPVLAWLRLDLRRRARPLLALALLVALAAGTVTAALAGARRGASAMDRLLAVTKPATAMIQANELGFDWEAVRRLPGVAALGTFVLTDVRLEERPEAMVGYPSTDRSLLTEIEAPVVTAGRLPELSAVDETVTTQDFLDRWDLALGDTVTARLMTPEELARDGEEDVTPTGPRQPLRIVGIVRTPAMVDSPELHTTPGFAERYRENLFGDRAIVNAIARLDAGSAGLPAFQRDFAALTGRADIEVTDLTVAAADRTAAGRFEAAVLLAFGLAALLAAIVLLGQAVVRYTAVSVADLRTLRTLGLTSGQAVLAAAAGPVLAAALGALLGGVAAVAVSPLFPVGTAREVEPAPGVAVDGTVLGGVALLVVLLIAAAAGGAAGWAAGAPGSGTDLPRRRSAVAAVAYRVGLPVAAVVGLRLALEPGRGRTAVPVRPALAGAVVGVLGVLGALTFRAGVLDAAGTPERFGQTAPLAAWVGFDGEDFGPYQPVAGSWLTDPDVVAVNDTRIGVVTIGSTSVTVYTDAPLGDRSLPVVALSGRMPSRPDEIALAPGSARDAGVRVGDTVAVSARAPARMTVTGIVFVPEGPHNGYAAGGWTTGAGYRRLFPDGFFKFHLALVALRPGADPAATAARLSGGDSGLDLEAQLEPAEAVRIRQVRVLPLALGAFLALLALGATGHALATAVRRRRHEMAVLRALGMTRRQSRLVVVTQAATLAAVGLVLGVPLGVAAGRVAWRAVATGTPLHYLPPMASGALWAIGPLALALVLLLATVPARRAGRLRLAETLRSE